MIQPNKDYVVNGLNLHVVMCLPGAQSVVSVEGRPKTEFYIVDNGVLEPSKASIFTKKAQAWRAEHGKGSGRAYWRGLAAIAEEVYRG